MNFEEAKQEFKNRYYVWAASEFAIEINESFPNLRVFKNGPVWSTLQFMQQIDRNEQLILAHCLLKRFHPDAAKMLGEGFLDEENTLLSRFDKFRSQFHGQLGHEASGEKIKFASKSKLRKAIVATFAKAYGDRCVRIQIGNEWDPWFEMKFAGWIVATRFTFGRHESMISYYHSIESEAKLPNPKVPPEFWMPTMRLGHHISFGSWLGMCSQTEWMSLAVGDVDRACDAVIKLCGRFFEALPHMLKGLEFENITDCGITGTQP